MAPAVSGFHGLAFFRGGMIAAAPRAAMASWHLRVSKAPSAVTLAICCSGGIWSSSSGSIPRRFARTVGAHRLDIAYVAGGELGRADFQRLLVNSDVDLAPVEP